MLKAQNRRTKSASGGEFVIIASRYNARYVDGMLRRAKSTLQHAGASKVVVIRVPGAFEIPSVAARVAATYAPPVSAVICLGVILRGETTHAQHIGEAVSQALAAIQVEYCLPIIHEVLLLENEDQAKARCLAVDCNRGDEAARTAIEMFQTFLSLERVLRA